MSGEGAARAKQDRDFPPHPVLEAIDRLRVGLTLFSANNVVLYANAHFRYLHRTLEKNAEVIGRRFPDLIRQKVISCEFLGDGRPLSGEDWITERARRIANNDWRPLELRLDDGRWIELKERSTANGGSVGIWSDITDLRMAHLRLEDAMSATADAFAYWSPHDRLQSFNPSFAEIAGFGDRNRRGDLTFHLWAEEAEHSGELAFLDGGVPDLPIAATDIVKSYVRHRDGRVFLLKQRRARDGGRVAVLTNVTDLFGSKRPQGLKPVIVQPAEIDAAPIADDRHRASATAASGFLRAINFELRNCLGSIIGFSEVIEGEVLGPTGAPEYTEYARMIRNSSNTLLKYVSSMIELTKVEAGDYDLACETENICDLIEARIDVFAPLLEAQGKRLQFDFDDRNTLSKFDPAAMESALDNLLKHAMNSTGEGGVISIRVAVQDSDLVIVVNDTGSGLSPRGADKLSEGDIGASNFSRPQMSEAETVGLLLARALVRLHGGTLVFKSRLHEGMSATITLPGAVCASEDAQDETAA